MCIVLDCMFFGCGIWVMWLMISGYGSVSRCELSVGSFVFCMISLICYLSVLMCDVSGVSMLIVVVFG